MFELLFPSGCHLIIEDVQVQTEKIDIFAYREVTTVPYPNCRQASTKVHSHYQRRPYDAPCFGFSV